MKALEEKILREGKIYPGDVLNVGTFLNQQIDVAFMTEMGAEIARLYGESGVTKILTVETSGIPIALAAAQSLNVDFVFAKKKQSTNMDSAVYSAKVHSYTHGVDYNITVAQDLLNEDDCVLLVDDFLAKSEAMCGLISLCEQAGAKVAGCAIAIEKGFQQGGARLRECGIRVESLAIIEEMTDSSLTFRS